MKRFAWENNKYVYRFVIVGVIAFVFNYALLEFLDAVTNLDHLASEAVSMLFSVQLTFFLHDRWTYKEAAGEREKYLWGIGKRYLSYLLSNSFSAVLTVVLFGLFAGLMPNVLALGFAAAISMAWNFTVNKLLIWRTHDRKSAEHEDA